MEILTINNYTNLYDQFINNYTFDGVISSKSSDNIKSKKCLFKVFGKLVLLQNLETCDKLSQLIDEYLIPHQNDKEQNAEISTPYGLRQEMLDTIDNYAPHIWTGIKYRKDGILDVRPARILEPCCGKGGFLIDCVSRLKKGLSQYFDNDEELYQCIVEDCIYFADINPLNIFICRLLLDPYNKYKLNYYLGDTLEQEFPCKFDLVVGNPPYNATARVGNCIWQNFTRIALEKWVKPNGYLLFVHPSGWRKPNNSRSSFNGMMKLMTINNTMLYLEIHGLKDGMETFKCGTRYDWYLIKVAMSNMRKTVIIGEDRKKYKCCLSQLSWLPNFNLNSIIKLLSIDDTIAVIKDSAYHSTTQAKKGIVSKEKTKIFKYPLVHATNKSGNNFLYSSVNNRGHFGIRKVIFGDSGINDVIIDDTGEYGMTEHGIAILLDDNDDGIALKEALLSDKFKSVMVACSWGNFQIDWTMFKNFKSKFRTLL